MARAPLSPEDHEIGAFVVVIEKKTLLFMQSSVFLQPERNHFTKGRCVND